MTSIASSRWGPSNGRPSTGRQSTNRLSTARPTTSSRSRHARTAVSTIGGAQKVVCAITESRGISATVGLCFVDMSTGECHLSEICDSQTYAHTVNKLFVHDPSEILFPFTSYAQQKTTLEGVIEFYMTDCAIISAPRNFYNEQAGREQIEQLACADDLAALMVSISGKYFAVTAAAAALKYVAINHMRFAPHTLRIKYRGSEGSMSIDPTTVRCLELIQNLQDDKSTDSLFGLLNNTSTAMGARFLKSNILQPSTEVGFINTRLDAVEEFTKHEEMFFQVKEALKGFPDMDRLCMALTSDLVKPSLKHTEQALNNIILFKQAAILVGPIYEALAPACSTLLLEIRTFCAPDKIDPVVTIINNVINEEASYSKGPLELRNQRCYAVKTGVNGMLDVARKAYKEFTEDIYSLSEELSNEYDIALELKYEHGRGFYFRLSVVDLEKNPLPPVFVNVIKRKKHMELGTIELCKRNKKVNDALRDVMQLSDETVDQLIQNIRDQINCLVRVGEAIGLLDMLCSFAHLCALQDYGNQFPYYISGNFGKIRPEFTENVAIKGLRHPIREKIHKDRFVPNDVYASQQARFQIITGCNMSGKSTYLRSVALVVIMAQIGSFVPATHAWLPITMQLFARISMDDSIEANVSTFAAEMRETAFILRNVEKGSLVIMDELGRGTSPRDGMAIALAICETLVETRAFVWFATHFKELTAILSERAGVMNLHMQVEIRSQSSMTMLYKLANGQVKDEHYGLLLARLAQLPESVMDRAALVSETLTKQRELAKKRSHMYNMARRRRAVLRLVESLKEARDGRMEEGALKSWLARLQREFVARMETLGGEEGESQIEEGDAMSIDGEDEQTKDGDADEDTTVGGTEETGDRDEEREWETLRDETESDEDGVLDEDDCLNFAEI